LSQARLRLGLALGVSALLHAALLLLFRAPEPLPAGDAMNVLIVPLEPVAARATPPVAPPAIGARSNPERKVEREARQLEGPPVAPAQAVSAPRGPSSSVTAGPISKPRQPPASQLADAATYVDAEQLRSWPKLVGKVAPSYPPRAYERRRKGVVVVQLMIDESGAVAEAVPLEGADEELTQAALAALRPARFRPAIGADGRPARARVFFEVSFVLE
jgi:protein TonB